MTDMAEVYKEIVLELMIEKRGLKEQIEELREGWLVSREEVTRLRQENQVLKENIEAMRMTQ